jgi:hypothetical protein
MRHTFRFTGIIVFAIVVLMFASSMHHTARAAVPPKKKVPQTYHLVFDRPSREGLRTESIGEVHVVDDIKGNSLGLDAGDMDSYLDAKYDVIEKVARLDPRGRPLTMRVYFKSLKYRMSATAAYEDAECARVPISVSMWPDLAITRDDGNDINPDEMELLGHIYGKQDPDLPSNDDDLAPDHDVSVGETWKPNTASMVKRFQAGGMIMPDNGLTVSVKLTGHKKVNGIDCLVVDMTLSCPNIDGLSNLPAEIRSAHANVDELDEWYLPVDPDAPSMFQSMTMHSKFTAVDTEDSRPVQVAGKMTETHTLTFVKEL